MKFGVLFLLLGCSFHAFAQMTAYANIFATVVAEQPIMFKKTANLTFNDISAQRTGTIVLKSNNTLTSSNNDLLLNGKGTVAAFSVVGGNLSTFDVTLPKESFEVADGNSSNMMVDNFTCIKSTITSRQFTESEIRISATLHVTARHETKSPDTQNVFPVTLNYN